MRILMLMMLLTTAVNLSAQHGKATTLKKTFSRTTTVSQLIDADESTIWNLLTRASDFPRWNSTVISLEGKIEKGEKIRLKSTLDSTRTFKLKVKELIPNREMIWGDAMGKRTYTLEKSGDKVLFRMTEKIGNPMFPLFANKIPPFDQSFEQFAADLKKAAEAK